MKQCPVCKWEEERATKATKFRCISLRAVDPRLQLRVKVCLNCGALSLWNENFIKKEVKK